MTNKNFQSIQSIADCFLDVRLANMNFAKFVDYCDSFVVNRGLSIPISGKKTQFTRLTPDAILLPDVYVADILQFIKKCEKIQRKAAVLLLEVERLLKEMVSVQFKRYSGDEYWHLRSQWFWRTSKEKKVNYLSEISSLIRNHSSFYELSGAETSDEIVYNLLSFTELTHIYYCFSGYQAKQKISQYFGCKEPDIFSSGIRILAKFFRNTAFHNTSSYRILDKGIVSNEQVQIDSRQMLYPGVNHALNFCNYYGRISFLVYITSRFADPDFQKERRDIKQLLQEIPLSAVDYLGIPSDWQSEPLWMTV